MTAYQEYRQATEVQLRRFLPGDKAAVAAANVVHSIAPKLREIEDHREDAERSQDRLIRLVQAVASVIADLDDGEDLSSDDLLQAVRDAGFDLYGPLLGAVEEVTLLRQAETQAVAL